MQAQLLASRFRSPRRHWLAVCAGALLPAALGCGSDDTTEVLPSGGTGGALVGGAGGTGGAPWGGGGTGTGTTGGGGSGASCEDPDTDEPNDDPSVAGNLLVLTDDDDPATWPRLEGVIAGLGDVDWYTYLGTDETGAYVDPEQAMVTSAPELELCAYFWCVDPNAWGPPELGSSGTSSHSCPPGTDEDDVDLSSVEFGGQPMGVAPGCCTKAGTSTFHLGEDLFNTFWTPFSCSGLTDDMKVYLRVAARHGAPDDLCASYAVRYHF